MGIVNRENRMEQKIYGMIQSRNRFFYSMGRQEAFTIQIKPFPAAWKKTPGKPWQRTRNAVINCQTLGVRLLELEPFAEYDRLTSRAYGLAPSSGGFAYEPVWDESIPFNEWNQGSNWRETLGSLFAQIDPPVLEKLRQFSHFHLQLLEALHEWPGFWELLESNAALAVSLAGRIRRGNKAGKRRDRLDYKGLVLKTEGEIAAALGFGDSNEVVEILRKLPPDCCKRYELENLPDQLKNPSVRNALLDARAISYPALLLLRNPVLAESLTGRFLADCAVLFPHSLDILTCPWGPLLRGGDGADQFMRVYTWALDVIEYYPEIMIESIDHLWDHFYASLAHRH